MKQATQMILVLLTRESRPVSIDTINIAIDKVLNIFQFDRTELLNYILDILNNPKDLEDAVKTARTELPKNISINDEQIETVIDNLLTNINYAGLDRNDIRTQLRANYNVRIDDFTSIERKPDPWVYKRNASIKWNFWDRYSDYLQYEKNFPTNVVDQIGRLTNKTLDGIFDPSLRGSITKYGLVVGQVQSGKTSNYTGLICKAVDSGFNMVIVLAGTQNSLRTQTQLRIDEGFLGFDTQFQRAFNTGKHIIGVGIGRSPLPAHSVTSSASGGDISSRTTLTFHTNEPIIAVIKKTRPRLEKLVQWLSAQAASDDKGDRKISTKNLLFIDDEADHASINTSKDNDPASTTNRLIREVIGLFDKVGYVGYTATPFANIFIPIEDDQLFPKDFIINLPAPSDYIGPDKVFGFSFLEEEQTSETVLPVVRRINDYSLFIPDKHKKSDLNAWKTKDLVDHNIVSHFRDLTPNSLKTAVKSFIITCSIRYLRGQVNVHNSMLIHVTRFQNWQKVIFLVVEELLGFYKRGIEFKTPSVLEELRQVFEVDSSEGKSFVTTTRMILSNGFEKLDHKIKEHSWKEVLNCLHEAASRIQVREINGGSKDVLNYFDHSNGLSVIAIGGDKLSRGLTLEGLSISYYLRASKMYDTLMQMGRWFGYRAGYTDLCRLFTSRELNEWFCHITHASEELRNEFDYMSDAAGATPEKYALKVRTHPGVLQISASNKIRKAVDINISWAGRLIESYELSKDSIIINRNLNTAVQFFKNLGTNYFIKKNNYLWYDIAAETILQFMRGFELSENLKAADPHNLHRFINSQLKNEELTSWRVALISKGKTDKSYSIDDKPYFIDIGNKLLKVGLSLRSYDKDKSSKDIYFLRNSRLISPKDEFIDLTEEEYNMALGKTRAMWLKRKKEGEPGYPNGEIVRNEMRNPQKPLLIIYFLSPKGANRLEDADKISDPIVAYAISFPGSRFNSAVSYKIPEQLLPFFDQEFEFEDDEEDDDED